MPMRVLRAHVRQLPALLADQALRFSQAVAVGSGTLKPNAARSQIADWQREAAGAPKVERPKTQTDLRSRAAALGIAVIIEPRRETT